MLNINPSIGVTVPALQARWDWPACEVELGAVVSAGEDAYSDSGSSPPRKSPGGSSQVALSPRCEDTAVVSPETAPEAPLLLNVTEVANALDVSESWVRRHALELPVVRVGGMLRFDRSLLLRQFQSRIVHGKSLKPERNCMLSRYQRGYVHQRGSKLKVWYGIFREDVRKPDGRVERRQCNVRLGTLAELPTKNTARQRLAESWRTPNHQRLWIFAN